MRKITQQVKGSFKSGCYAGLEKKTRAVRALSGMLDYNAMNSAIALFLPVALQSLAQPVTVTAELSPAEDSVAGWGASVEGAGFWKGLLEAYRPEAQEQVRIERRVIVRISPRAPTQDANGPGAAALPAPRRYEEKRMGKCVPIKGISSVQISRQDRLLLFMRDHRIVSVKLDKSCSVRDYYSGFYVEDSDDGMICAGRDTLHSRAGVNCSVTKLHRLVPSDD